ncbi:MAG: hypothetical protein KKG59_05870 [Nanoarchaeota archaeon]|nr:hypothetical protein [Nanoarchaeota archaeon]
MVYRHINLGLVIIGIIGFAVSSFYLIYSNLSGGFFLSLFFAVLFIEAYILRIQDNHVRRERKHHPQHMQPEYFPLSSGFMLTSIVGFVLSLTAIAPFFLAWGVTFALIFALMFISSVIDMTKGPLIGHPKEELYMAELAIHDKTRRHKLRHHEHKVTS